MRNLRFIFALWALLAAVLAAAQPAPGLSRSQADQRYVQIANVAGYASMMDLWRAEGRPLIGPANGVSYGTRPTVTAGAIQFTQTAPISEGRAGILMEASAGMDQSGTIALRIGWPTKSGAFNLARVEYVPLGANGGSHSWSFGGLVVPELTTIDLGYIPSTTGANAGPFFTGGVNGFDITSDFNYGALRVFGVLGNSIEHTMPGSNGNATKKGADLFPFRLVDGMRDRGASVRLVNKAFGGSTLPQIAQYCDEGWIDWARCDLMLLAGGMNDAADGSVGETAYKAAIRSIIKRIKRNFPTCDILLCGDVNTTDAQRLYGAPIRSNTSQAITSTTITLDSGASAVDGTYVGDVVRWQTSTSVFGWATITGYVGSTRVATVSGWTGTTNPTGTPSYKLYDANSTENVAESYIARTRRWMSEVQAEYPASAEIYYVDMSAAYTMGEVATYTGDLYVHPNVAGMGRIYDVVKLKLAQTNFYRNDLKLGNSWVDVAFYDPMGDWVATQEAARSNFALAI